MPDPVATTPFVTESGSNSTPAERRRVDLVPDVTTDPDADLTAFLRGRLRQAVLMFLGGYAAFLARDLVAPEGSTSSFQAAALGAAVFLQIGLVALAWSAWPRTARRLHTIEASNLAVAVGLLAIIQFDHLRSWPGIAPLLDGALPSRDGQVILANTWVIPWFCLITGFPVVVPNPVRRTLVTCGLIALVPAVVTLAAMADSPELRAAPTRLMFFQYAVWGTIGVGIATYGARRADLLREQVRAAKRFGQYRLTRKLGGGGMGDVYLAEHLLLKRPAVVKTVRPDRAGDPGVVRRFEREVRILATLTHWNTVAVFDYGYTADGTFYYAMEYLPGFDLDRLVARHGPLPPGRAVHLLRQVCAALREAHGVGLIHRDVKPGNVMVCRRGGVADVAKLLDFGLVHAVAPADSDPDPLGKITRDGTVMGTPAYMSPEQAAGRKLDARSDVYSLGATAFFLLTGRPVFEKPGAMEVIAAHLLEPARRPRDANPAVPPDVDAVVHRCLAKAPADRYETVAELAAALAGCDGAAAWTEADADAWWGEREREG